MQDCIILIFSPAAHIGASGSLLSMTHSFDSAKALYLEGRLYDCLEACEALLGEQPNDAPTLNLLGMLCHRAGDIDSAIPYFQQCIEAAPDFAEAYGNLAVMLKTQGRLAEALEAYGKGLALDPDNAQAQLNFGLALHSTGRDAEAVAPLRHAIALAPYMTEAYNALGLCLLKTGQIEEAAATFRNAIAAEPGALPAYDNLVGALRRLNRLDEAVMVLRWTVGVHGVTARGQILAETLAETGKLHEAMGVLSDLITASPLNAAAWDIRGALRFRQGQFELALGDLLKATLIDERRASAHMRIYNVAQVLRRPALALAHQAQALAQTRLFTETGVDSTLPALLILNAAGNWQANVPTDFIIRREAWSAVHQYYVRNDGSFDPAELPPCDVIFNAVAEPDMVRPAFATAAAIVDFLGLPCVNDPRQVAQTERQIIAGKLADLPATIIPATVRLRTTEAPLAIGDLLTNGQLTLPILVRPVGTHAGDGMFLADSQGALAQGLAGIAADELYAAQFIDTCSTDGLYRKYRVVVVDGQAFPFHMAQSKRWMVHYYNAENDDPSQMDREEEYFLAHFDEVFSPAIRADLAEMGQRLGLDYLAVDCALTQDGEKLVLFEVDVGAVIHTLDDPRRHPHKHLYVPRIFDAVQAMLKSRIEKKR